MSTPQERIEADLRSALKAKETERRDTLRLLLSEIKNERIKEGQDVDEPTFLRLVQKLIKQRHEAAEQYRKGNRPELAAKEEREAEILGAYLPKQASEAEIRSAIEELVEAEGLAGPKAMGPVMKAMMARFAGSADGATVSRLAREVLGN